MLERSQLAKPVGAREATSRGMEYIPTSAPRRNRGGGGGGGGGGGAWGGVESGKGVRGENNIKYDSSSTSAPP